MRVVTIPTEQKFLFDLLKTVREDGLILQTSDGQQFVLLSLQDWHGFDVGDSDDFEQEVAATSENKDLLAFLTARRSNGKRVRLADIKKRLDLD